MTWAHSYIMAAEDLLEAEVPERAEYIRLMAAEVQRLASHLMWLGAFGPDIGNLTLMTWCLRDREMFLDFARTRWFSYALQLSKSWRCKEGHTNRMGKQTQG